MTTMKRIGKWVVGVVLAVAAMGAQAGTGTYYHNDLAGSPVVATNEAGEVIWRESYRPYGERTVKSAAASGNKVWFTSRHQDADTGLVYMGARYYDPVTGRFVSTDPVGFDEQNLHSFKRYAYTNSNPYKYIDPDGHAGVLATAAMGAGAGTAVWPGVGTVVGGAVGFGVGVWATWKVGNLILNEGISANGAPNAEANNGSASTDAGG